MTTLIAIGYPAEFTAASAADEARRLARDLLIEPDSIAVVRRDREGTFHVTTSHHALGTGASWGMLWGLLFGLVFFVPVLGTTVGAGLGALLRAIRDAGIDGEFQDDIRDMAQPGSSALFLIVERIAPERAVDALRPYGGTVLMSTLSEKAEADLRHELHGPALASRGAP